MYCTSIFQQQLFAQTLHSRIANEKRRCPDGEDSKKNRTGYKLFCRWKNCGLDPVIGVEYAASGTEYCLTAGGVSGGYRTRLSPFVLDPRA